MSFIDNVKAKAKENKKVIVLPESEDERTYHAAAQVIKEGTADLILIGKEDVVADSAKKYGTDISAVKVVDPENFDKLDAYVDTLTELRKKKGMTPEKARETLLNDYVTFAVMMLKMDDADGVVTGACHSTADAVRPALQILKTAPNTEIASSFFVMVVPDCEYGEDGVFVFADCAINQDPDSAQLAAIANSSAQSFKSIVGAEPKVAMLSHSTKGSAKHELVDKVAEATRIAKEKYPDLKLDGELQADASIVPSVAASKAKGSDVAGSANVLIFPNIDAGNICYKLVQRLGKVDAYGPILQGIAKPINDLSRGCSAEDIAGVVAITVCQAQ